VNDLAVLSVLAIGTLAAAQARRCVLDGVARRAVLFAAVGAGSALLAVPRFGLTAREVVFSLAYLARWLAYFGVYVVAVNSLRRRDVPPLLGALENVILAFAAFGIVQSAFLPGFAQIVYPDSTLYVDWDPQGRRLVSTILDPNLAGAFICFGLLIAVARVSCGERMRPWRIAVLATALLLTASRSTILATLAGLAVIAATAGVSRRVVRAGVALGAGALLATPYLLRFAAAYGKLSIDASALERLVSWLRALELIADHPLIGIGFNTYGFAQRAYGYEARAGAYSYSLDGGLLFIAVMTGGVGLALFVAMLWRIGRRARAVWRAADAAVVERAAAVGAVASLVAIVVHSLFVNSLLHPFLMEPLWLLAALSAVAARRDGHA
jgi:O-antigen ligase